MPEEITRTSWLLRHLASLVSHHLRVPMDQRSQNHRVSPAGTTHRDYPVQDISVHPLWVHPGLVVGIGSDELREAT